MRFLDQTRAALAEILEGGSKEAEDVTVLLKVSTAAVLCELGSGPLPVTFLLLAVTYQVPGTH